MCLSSFETAARNTKCALSKITKNSNNKNRSGQIKAGTTGQGLQSTHDLKREAGLKWAFLETNANFWESKKKKEAKFSHWVTKGKEEKGDCYGFNVSQRNSYVQILTPNSMVLGGRTFGSH